MGKISKIAKAMFFSIVVCILFLLLGSVSAIDSNNVTDASNLLKENNNVVFSSQNMISSNDSSSHTNLNNHFSENNSLSNSLQSNNVLGFSFQGSIRANEVKPTLLVGNDTELYFKNGTSFKVLLSDNDGNPLSDQSVIFTINNVNYTRKTNDEGIASIKLNLNSGNYEVISTYDGTSSYESSSTTNLVKIISTISADDVEKYYKNNTQYYATFVNAVGKPLANTVVTFNINGVFYERRTNANGVAKLNINLDSGEYILTALNPINGETHSNIITVLPTVYAFDTVKYYKNNTQYYATFVNAVGKPLANTPVSFNINGVFYERKTNDAGVAKLNINLNPGDFVITTVNPMNGEVHSNIITVLSTISTDDLSMFYKDGSKFTAKILDDAGNPLVNSKVIFNINGVLYSRVTDSAGNAYLNINLDVGEYVITTTDYKGLSVSNMIKIAKSRTTIIANDAHLISGLDRTYSVILVGSNNKTIPLNSIKFKYNGAKVTSVTNENGEATLLISNPLEGKYSIEYGFEGNKNYYSYKSSSTIIVENPTNVLTGKDLKMFYQDGSKFNVTLTNLNSTPMANKTITFNICGVSYNRTTNENGVAGLNINLHPGTYEISYSYSDIDAVDYNRGSNTIVVSKLPAYLTTNDLFFNYGDGGVFSAMLVDGNNTPLEGMTVKFKVNGVSYYRATNASGIAKLNINLPVGYYEITTSLDSAFYGAKSKSNHILVNGTILIADDLYLIEGFSREYSVTLLNAYRNPIPNAAIEFTYNGISKRANTNAQGMATIVVDGLSKGNYAIIYRYIDDDSKGQCNIQVSNSVLNSKNTISNLGPYLSDSRNCQVSNAEIVAFARQLTEGFTQPLDKAIAIYNYVRDSIPYSYYYNTLFGAVGTLHAQVGNCVDQSHLSIALYRAAGFPARYVHGTCLFSDGEWYGHVWVQVLVGDTWIVSDSINARNSLGNVVNWNNYNCNIKGYYSSLNF